MDPERHLVVVAPHPDDETLALGGTIYDHLRRGGSCAIVAVSDGEAADNLAGEDARRAMATRRAEERRAAMAILGAGAIEVIRLALPDRRIDRHEGQLAQSLCDLLAREEHRDRRCLVVLPWRRDPHVDHRAVCRAGIRATANMGVAYVEVPIWAWYWPHWRKRLPSSRLRQLPITEQARRAKQAALRCFVSQLEPLPTARGPVLPAGFLQSFADNHEVILA